MFDLYGSLKGIWYPNTRHFLQCFCDPIQKWKNVLSKGRNSHGCKAVICKIPCIDCKAVKLSFFCILAIHARQLSKKLPCIEVVPLNCSKTALLTSDIARHLFPLARLQFSRLQGSKNTALHACNVSKNLQGSFG